MLAPKDGQGHELRMFNNRNRAEKPDCHKELPFCSGELRSQAN